LGGGHGWLQGRHGTIGDQFESANIVLANSTLATIDSSSDLWWAIKGAGHNFGIVTSVTSKTYNIEHKDWAIEILTFSGSKVVELYEAVNTHLLKNGTQPTDLINWSYWVNVPSADANHVSLSFFLQISSVSVSNEYL
jgi:FAD/FMN-containing dehydrogenase